MPYGFKSRPRHQLSVVLASGLDGNILIRSETLNPLESIACQCPYCSEVIEIEIDRSQSAGDYIEDCHVCCQPIEVRMQMDEQGRVDLQLRRDNE